MTGHSALRFAANLKWLFTDVPLEERFDGAARGGFHGVEVPSPYGIAPDALRRIADDAGVTVVLINTPQGEPGSPTAGGLACWPGMANEFQESVDRGLEYADHLGAAFLHVVGGRRPEGVSRVQAFAQYVRNLTWAAERARHTGVGIVIEMQNHRTAPRFVLENQAMAAAVIEAVGSGVGLLLDVFHTQVQQGDVGHALETYLPITWHIQVGDSPGRTEPGTGELSWPFVADRIRESDYDGWIGCEFTPSNTSAGVIDRLKAVM